MTEGCSKGRQKSRSPESDHVITIITTSLAVLILIFENVRKFYFIHQTLLSLYLPTSYFIKKQIPLIPLRWIGWKRMGG